MPRFVRNDGTAIEERNRDGWQRRTRLSLNALLTMETIYERFSGESSWIHQQ